MVWVNKIMMKRLLIIILLLVILGTPIIALASNISGAQYYGIIQISNNSTLTEHVATTCSINTTNLINGNYLNASANNCVMRTSSGADVPFMPGYTPDGYPWCIWVPSIGTDGYQSDILYTANSTGGEIRYFPDVGGMTTSDNETMELGDNFTIEQKGWIDTTQVGAYLTDKEGAFRTYISGTGNITSDISSISDFTTYTEVDPNGKLTVTTTRATAADADADENVYLYKDGGADRFDALDVNFEIYIAATSLDQSRGGMAITNTIGTLASFAATDVTATTFNNVGSFEILLVRGSNVVIDIYVGAANTLYYCTLTRVAGNDSVSLLIYSDSARTILLDTLVVAGYGAVKWQYVYGFVNRNSTDAGRDFDGYVQNFNLPGITLTSVTATGIASGNHTVTTAANTTHFWIDIDGSTEDSIGGWQSPTGHNDPGGTWTTEELAYDGDLGTRADTAPGIGVWSNFLELTCDSFLTSSVRTWISGIGAGEVDVDAYYGGAWVDVFSGAYSDGAWDEHPLVSAQTVNMTRVRVKSNVIAQVRFYEVATLESIASVPNNSSNWTFLQDDTMPYMEYQRISVNGTLRQHIEWEYDNIFTDLSGYDNDAVPTFRTASSDADVTANLTSFKPVAEAKAPDYVLGEAPPFIDEDITGNVTGTFTTTPGTGAFPLAEVIFAIATATDTPPQLPLLIIACFIILAASLSVSATMRRYGSGSIFVKILVILAFMGVFIALKNFGIDFWMLAVFAIIGIALAMASRQSSFA